MPLGREIDFVGHTTVKIDQFGSSELQDISNIIVYTENAEFKWIEETSKNVGEWRARFMSTYIRWALSINGLHVAAEKYSNKAWKAEKQFNVESIRVRDNTIEKAVIAQWKGDFASKAHLETIGMLSGWGLIDLCGCMEEFVFDFYKIYLTHHPDILLQGDEFKKLKKLYKQSLIDDSVKDEWDKEFTNRLLKWQRKRLYDGLGNVFLSYCTEANIQAPTGYEFSNPQTWSESIDGVFQVRNALIHGGKKVSKELALFCTKPYSLAFKFKEDEPLEITLLHLQSVEMFADQLLTALNLAILEIFLPPKNR